MGLFDSFIAIQLTVCGLIRVDYNQQIANETIEWADELYSRNSQNIESAFACLELRGDLLVRRFYYLQEKQAYLIEFPEFVDINSLEDEVLQSEQFKELKKTGRIIIKKY